MNVSPEIAPWHSEEAAAAAADDDASPVPLRPVGNR